MYGYRQELLLFSDVHSFLSYRFYAVVVVRSATPDPNQAAYDDAGPYFNGAPYYIAAAWAREDISRVPVGLYTVGDGSTTLANMVVYTNAGLKSNTGYGLFVRIDIESDAGDVVRIQTAELGL